jgi:hypothetical protein
MMVDVLTMKALYQWSIEVLDSFEEFWEYDILNFPNELTDYLAFAIKEYEKFEELIKELSM